MPLNENQSTLKSLSIENVESKNKYIIEKSEVFTKVHKSYNLLKRISHLLESTEMLLWCVVSIFVGPSQARRASRARASDGPTKILQKKFPKLSKIRRQNSYLIIFRMF